MQLVISELTMIVGTLPKEFKSKNHWGLLLRSMLNVSYLEYEKGYEILSLCVIRNNFEWSPRVEAVGRSSCVNWSEAE